MKATDPYTRERARKREGETDRQTERQRETETERDQGDNSIRRKAKQLPNFVLTFTALHRLIALTTVDCIADFGVPLHGCAELIKYTECQP